jgi:hypothetical protein
MNRTVYIVEDSPGKNFLPAKEFGLLRVMLTGREEINVAQDKLRLVMTNMVEDDFLLLVGSPVHIAMASFRVLNRFGKANFLVWNREEYKYDHRIVKL